MSTGFIMESDSHNVMLFYATYGVHYKNISLTQQQTSVSPALSAEYITQNEFAYTNIYNVGSHFRHRVPRNAVIISTTCTLLIKMWTVLPANLYNQHTQNHSDRVCCMY